MTLPTGRPGAGNTGAHRPSVFCDLAITMRKRGPFHRALAGHSFVRMVTPGEGPPDGLHGGRRTTTTARWLGVLAGVLTVTFGLLLALTDHLATSPGA